VSSGRRWWPGFPGPAPRASQPVSQEMPFSAAGQSLPSLPGDRLQHRPGMVPLRVIPLRGGVACLCMIAYSCVYQDCMKSTLFSSFQEHKLWTLAELGLKPDSIGPQPCDLRKIAC
ncbi:hypothetical protein H1C71_033734, partial [Ictidomys tridecemlineatus]